MATLTPLPARPATSAARRWAIDAGIAVGVILLELASSYSAQSWHGQRHGALGWLGYVLIIVGGLSLLARRRYPVAVLAVTLAAALWAEALHWNAWFALIAAFITAVLARKRAAAVASLIIGYLVSVWPPWLIGSPGHTSTVFAVSLLAGLITLLSLAELNRAWNQRTAAVRRGREEEALRRASEERLAIARDLHDVVAHNISVINVQANTALHLMDRQPERAREALTAIHEVSRQALAEFRSVLGVLRTTGYPAAPLAPSPGIGGLSELASRAGSAGITVRLLEEGAPRPLPAGVDAAAYRIVQEALTNIVRHSGGTAATVRLSYDTGALKIEVDDDGTASGPMSSVLTGSAPMGSAPMGSAPMGSAPAGSASATGGNGLAGMTERARALGGTLDAGPRPGGGFRVLALLPLTGGAS